MTTRVTIAAHGREVTVETSDTGRPVGAVVADALTAWTHARPTAERAEAPSCTHDCPITGGR